MSTEVKKIHKWPRHSFFFLLLWIIALFINPTDAVSFTWSDESTVLYTVFVLLSGVYVLSFDYRLVIAAVIIAVPSIIIDALDFFLKDLDLMSVSCLFKSLFFCLFSFAVLEKLYNSPLVDANAIVGVVCVYFFHRIWIFLFICFTGTFLPWIV